MALWDIRDPEHPSLAMDHGAPVEAVLVLPGGGLVASVGGEFLFWGEGGFEVFFFIWDIV